MPEPFRDFHVRQGFGALQLSVRANLMDSGDNFHSVDISIDIQDEPLKLIIKRGLERLSGQGKIDEELRSMCACVAGLYQDG